MQREAFLREVVFEQQRVADFAKYPFSIPAVKALDRLKLHHKVTFLVGENGSGKSTLIEAIAVAAGFNAEGGTTNFNFATRRSESELHTYLKLVRGSKRERTGYFLRAESYFNVASNIEELDTVDRGPPVIDSYGGVSLHEQSHGESFLALLKNRFGPQGLYILDEPEAALSPQRQLSLLKVIDELVNDGRSQFIIATHSPIVLSYPDALIYSLDGPGGVVEVGYEETDHFKLTRDFLNHRELFLRRLFSGS